MGELTPYICVADACRAIDWYVDVLGAEVVQGRGVPRSLRSPWFLNQRLG